MPAFHSYPLELFICFPPFLPPPSSLLHSTRTEPAYQVMADRSKMFCMAPYFFL
jgi:hypothetical protein